MKKILLLISSLTSLAFMQDECSEITNPEACYDMGCEWITLYEEISNELIVTEGCSEIGYGSDWDDEENYCEGLTQDECVLSEGCEWLADSNNPNSLGSCIEIGDDNDGPPECVMDCEGIENVSPEEDATYFCNWLFDVLPSGCAEDCEQEILNEIEEVMIMCDECLSDDNCDGIFDDDCQDLNEEECMNAPECQPNYDITGQFESCNEYNNQHLPSPFCMQLAYFLV